MPLPLESHINDAGVFETLRPRLIRIAYRMVGTHAEAEDIVQDAWLRWSAADREIIREPKAWLTRVVSRLALDHLKSARVRRETYPGTWLPEPLVETYEDRSDDITLTLMLALDRLSPLERAAFLLHDVFDMGFDEVGRVLGRDAVACRQLASRARSHVRQEKSRFNVPEDRGRTIAEAFFQASRSGDMTALKGLLAEDVVMYSDGGGIRNAALNPIYGREKIMRLYEGIARKAFGKVPAVNHFALFDGLPGHMSLEADGLPQVAAIEIEDELIRTVYLIRNPQKLTHLRMDELIRPCREPDSL
ncbi:sigma-70 family RNA polymerase sigma factor [Brucella pseudogrignonensis]|uniref:sigma-70 family RNA polymerase sigma factor n=1 Tax=Brucella pseudogrignonensis TaxID=419475 RepID=UPI0028BBA35D|nr:sigma-70 family RNA polymerase sigma factor [Brucella pseudogrignonensis]MDT6939290.1 sigma-70 family RNA polymerase sigma factor [Brucella pseudogrignonensis]